MTARSSRLPERAETSEKCAKSNFLTSFRENFRDRRPIVGAVAPQRRSAAAAAPQILSVPHEGRHDLRHHIAACVVISQGEL